MRSRVRSCSYCAQNYAAPLDIIDWRKRGGGRNEATRLKDDVETVATKQLTPGAMLGPRQKSIQTRT